MDLKCYHKMENNKLHFREMRRKRQLLPESECIDILHRATSGTLALLGDNNYPYALPISFVFDNGYIYFHSAKTGHKIDAIINCNKASFCIIDQDDVKPKEFTTYFRSVITFGHISIVESEEEKLKALKLLGYKYNPNDDEVLKKEINKDFSHVAIIRLDIEHMTGKEAIEIVRMK